MVATMTDPMGHDTDYGYDDWGRQTTVTNNDRYRSRSNRMTPRLGWKMGTF